MSMSFEMRRSIEQRIIIKAVQDILAAGYLITVCDGGEENPVEKSSDFHEVMAALMNTDTDELLLFKPNEWQQKGWIQLIYGNDGWDVIANHTVNIEPVLKGANELADMIERKMG